LAVHEKALKYRPDNQRGSETKELLIKGKLDEVRGDGKEVERLFSIVKQQS